MSLPSQSFIVCFEHPRWLSVGKVCHSLINRAGGADFAKAIQTTWDYLRLRRVCGATPQSSMASPVPHSSGMFDGHSPASCEGMLAFQRAYLVLFVHEDLV